MTAPHSSQPPPLTSQQWAWRWRVLISTYIGYTGYYLTRKVFTICKTSIAADMGWELSDTGHIWAAFLLAYMLGQFINSFVGRKWGPRLILLIGLASSIAINLVFGITNSYATFLVFMFVNGLVQATGWPGVVGGISQWLRGQERGTFMGVWSTSYLVGNLMVKFLGGYLLGAYGWRYAFFGCTVLSMAVWWLLYFWQRNKPEDVGLESVVQRTGEDMRAVRAVESDTVTFREYLAILTNPVILTMGCSYFCIKFMRYALDSWLPSFLNIQGMGVDTASYASSIFDMAGLAGAVVAGLLLDRVFRGNWALLCFLMGLGVIGGYLSVIYLATTPMTVALCFGIVGFMIYGPDTLICGAASIDVAGEKNGVAVAGIVNGIGSIGPVVQEEVITWLMRGDDHQGICNTNRLALSMSIAFVCLMLPVMLRLRIAHRKHREAG